MRNFKSGIKGMVIAVLATVFLSSSLFSHCFLREALAFQGMPACHHADRHSSSPDEPICTCRILPAISVRPSFEVVPERASSGQKHFLDSFCLLHPAFTLSFRMTDDNQWYGQSPPQILHSRFSIPLRL